jgi:hypothetical protein
MQQAELKLIIIQVPWREAASTDNEWDTNLGARIFWELCRWTQTQQIRLSIGIVPRTDH